MKKIIILILIFASVILLSGCNNKEIYSDIETWFTRSFSEYSSNKNSLFDKSYLCAEVYIPGDIGKDVDITWSTSSNDISLTFVNWLEREDSDGSYDLFGNSIKSQNFYRLKVNNTYYERTPVKVKATIKYSGVTYEKEFDLYLASRVEFVMTKTYGMSESSEGWSTSSSSSGTYQQGTVKYTKSLSRGIDIYRNLLFVHYSHIKTYKSGYKDKEIYDITYNPITKMLEIKDMVTIDLSRRHSRSEYNEEVYTALETSTFFAGLRALDAYYKESKMENMLSICYSDNYSIDYVFGL